MSNEEKEESSGFVYLGALIPLIVIGLISIRIYQIGNETAIADNTCKVLDLGNYHLGSQNDITQKDIDGQKYFKCTKDIYNSTTKEIITVEKWVRMP